MLSLYDITHKTCVAPTTARLNLLQAVAGSSYGARRITFSASSAQVS